MNENTIKFDEICSIPLTNLIGKFLRDLVASGKTFSLELRLDSTPDGAAQIDTLLKESKFAYKYSDRLSVRAQEEGLRGETANGRQSITSKSLIPLPNLLTSKSHQRLVIENYSNIPEIKREEIESILARSRVRDSVKIIDGKTYSETGSVMASPYRSRYESSAVQQPDSTLKPSSFSVYKSIQQGSSFHSTPPPPFPADARRKYQ